MQNEGRKFLVDKNEHWRPKRAVIDSEAVSFCFLTYYESFGHIFWMMLCCSKYSVAKSLRNAASRTPWSTVIRWITLWKLCLRYLDLAFILEKKVREATFKEHYSTGCKWCVYFTDKEPEALQGVKVIKLVTAELEIGI